MDELKDNDVRDKRERLVACILSGNSKMYLGKEYTEQQINEMDCTNVITLSNRYESVLSAQMTKSLGKSVINLYSNIACSVLGIGNQQELSTDLESYPFLNTALQRFTCDLYCRFGALLAPVSIGIITGIVCTISFERPVNYLCDAWHVFPPKYEAWTHFNN